MKTIKLSMLGVLSIIAIGLTSCGDEKKETELEVETVEVEAEEPQKELVVPEAEVTFDNPEIDTVFVQYLELKNALVKTDTFQARSAAAGLYAELQEMNAEQSLLDVAQKISNSDDINVQREDFQEISAKLESMVAGAVKSGKVFKQYCPMAFEGEGGFWLATTDEIRNPYYGDKMLKCGSVQETFE